MTAVITPAMTSWSLQAVSNVEEKTIEKLVHGAESHRFKVSIFFRLKDWHVVTGTPDRKGESSTKKRT